MKIKEIVHILDDWAPPGAAWERDNPGLQVGSIENEVQNILVCLDVTQEVIKEAITKNCNLIISHHPLLFNYIKRIETDNDTTSKIITALIKNDITLFSAHTNLDFSIDGVSFALAKLIGLQNCRFLKKQEGSQCKLSVFVPAAQLEMVADALFSAGGGVIGEYSRCSFLTEGTGTFLGSANTHPVIGSKGVLEKTAEVKLEMVFPKWRTRAITKALLKSHPYEEPAYDIYPLAGSTVNFGSGVIGELPAVLQMDKFLEMLKTTLNISALKYTNGRHDSIVKVALCGGSGVELLNTALEQNADAFITADVKYHAFHEAKGKICLVDAGHYETELPILPVICGRIRNYLETNGNSLQVNHTEISTNPVKIFK